MKKLKKLAAVGMALAVGVSCSALFGCADSPEKQYINSAATATAAAEYKSYRAAMSLYMSTDTSESHERISVRVGAIVNPYAQDADIVAQLNPVPGDINTSYSFMRDGFGFQTVDTFASGVDSFEGVAMRELSLDSMSVILGQGVGTAPQLTDASAMLAFAAFAEAYGAVTMADSSLTINLVDLAEGVVGAVDSIVNSLTDQTTIEQIYNDEFFKNMLGALEMVFSAQDLYDFVQNLGQPAVSAGGAANSLIPQPTEGQSLYDYINGILTDDEFSAATGLDKPAGQITVCELFTLISGAAQPVTAAQIKEEYGAIRDKFSFDDGLTITVAENAVAVVSKADFVCTFNESDELVGVTAGIVIDLDDNAWKDKLQASLEIEYSKTEAELEDISKAVIGGITVGEYLQSGGNGSSTLPGDDSQALPDNP